MLTKQNREKQPPGKFAPSTRHMPPPRTKTPVQPSQPPRPPNVSSLPSPSQPSLLPSPHQPPKSHDRPEQRLDSVFDFKKPSSQPSSHTPPRPPRISTETPPKPKLDTLKPINEAPFKPQEGNKNDDSTISICPYCGKDLNFPKTPKFCPYCREPISM